MILIGSGRSRLDAGVILSEAEAPARARASFLSGTSGVCPPWAAPLCVLCARRGHPRHGRPPCASTG
eukprot:8706507-Pyramimonas_sp.AAC.1